MKNVIFCLILTAAFCLSAEDADGLYAQGIEALRAGQNVAAVKALARAVELAEAAGDDAKATEVGSALYWTKKRLNISEAAALHQTDEKAEKKAEAIVSKKVESSDADKWLDRAQKFAAAHADDQLRCAIVYFELADRFPMTSAGRTAMAASLAAMGEIKNEPVKVAAKPVAKVSSGSMKPEDVLVAWDFGSGWSIADGRIRGIFQSSDNLYGISLKSPVTVSAAEFSFSIKAPQYQIATVSIGSENWTFSRGHWNNSATLVFSGSQKKELKIPGNVSGADMFHEMKITIDQGNVIWSYDGSIVFKGKTSEKAPYQFRCGFGGHFTNAELMNVSLKYK